jgi:hypothetical protein
MLLRQHAALASGKLTHVTSGVNLPPSEVIMSGPPSPYKAVAEQDEQRDLRVDLSCTVARCRSLVYTGERP